jgi:FkbM family methyltransferase
LSSRFAKAPVYVRSGTSDVRVFKQIFVDREYSCLDCMNDVKTVIDCGANVGYSSVYFLNRFKDCNVVCIEPESSNFEMLQMNMAKYPGRARMIKGGVWSHATNLKISGNVYRDGGNWAKQVEECGMDEPDSIPAFGIYDIIAKSGVDKISLLKMDIEGAEVVVFSRDISSWIHRIENLVIEIHDDSLFGPATNLILDRIKSVRKFNVSRFGELTLFQF